MISDVTQIIPIRQAYPAGPAAAPTARVASDAPEAVDTVEFSTVGRALARAADLSSFQLARIRAIRTEIESGTYVTPERMNGAVDRLLNLLG